MEERDLNERVEGASSKGGKVEQVPSTWPIDGQATWFASFFSKRGFSRRTARGAVFHSYFHGRDPFIEGCNAALQESISNGASRAPFLRLFFPPRVFP